MGNPWCSRYCCQASVHQALELHGLGKSVTVLARDVRTFGRGAEESYQKARESGIDFIKFTEGSRPEIIERGGRMEVMIPEPLVGRTLGIPCDRVVLAAGMEPPGGAEDLRNLLKVPFSQDGFWMEQHPKLGPVRTNTEGIFLCGCASGPKTATDSLAQASGAAAGALASLAKDEIEVEATTASVNPDICWGCGTCVEICPFGAPELKGREGKEGERVAVVNEALCKGCGMCASSCPSGAITARHFTREQLLEEIRSLCRKDGGEASG
jgi:heterodisulfide reductase subunit A